MHHLDFEKPIIELEKKIEELSKLTLKDDDMLKPEIERLKERASELRTSIFSNLTRWQRVLLARHPDRPYTLDYISLITERFMELHGDRKFADDPAMVGGIGTIDGKSVMIIGQQKGRDTKDRKYRNFGMANPDGYRKAHRLMKLAEKFKLPVITLLDTPGAYPGLEAEERGQAEAIASNLKMMATLKVPTISVVIGEGASGGALGIGVTDKILMMENSWYSVISPESCSSILWRTPEFKEDAADNLRLTAQDLVNLKIVDGIIEEPLGGAHRDYNAAATALKTKVMQAFDELAELSTEELIEQRIQKYSAMGAWVEA